MSSLFSAETNLRNRGREHRLVIKDTIDGLTVRGNEGVCKMLQISMAVGSKTHSRDSDLF